MARAIAYLAENFAAQPSLEDAARASGISPFHFQRLFTRHTGVSPKNFVAHLTLERAKESLRLGETVSSAAWQAGLSGASRLHDLSLKVEAMTPGEYAKGGEGLILAYGFAPSLFGTSLLMATERGLCGLAFGDDEDAMLADMVSRWPRAKFVRDDAKLAPYADKIFSGAKGALPIQLFGTPWQIKVWDVLLRIPEGKVVSYSDIAHSLRAAKASRAVGTAVGRNPISLLIPCHRVLSSTGAITGYHWGTTRKRAMLAWEAAKHDEVSA